MTNLQKVDRNLWIITGATSIPFLILAFVDTAKIVLPNLYFLIALAGLFNAIFVPFFLMKGDIDWIKKTVALGGNIIIATFWIKYTGGTNSIFYPVFFLIPIVASSMFGGYVDAIISALVTSIITLMFKYFEVGAFSGSIVSDSKIMVQLVLFFLVGSVAGYLIKIQREQFGRNQKMNEELEIAYNQLSASHNQLQGYTGIIEKMNREMEQLAITDELTMLHNYRYFQITLDKELKRNRYSSLTLIMMDIDNFKSYNDLHGHMSGNRVLSEMAKIMKSCVRDIDTVVRYGGEEFAVVMPATEIDEAHQMAEKIRSQIEQLVVTTPEGKSSSVTISCGISCYPKDASNKSELISHADLALYQAKTNGRNKTEVYQLENMVG